MQDRISDPNVLHYNGKYYLSGSGGRSVHFRVSDTIDGLFTAEPIQIYKIPDSDTEHSNMWAPELHVIHGVPCVLTTVGKHQWYTVRCHVLRCNGDPSNPNDWEAPRLMLKPNGTELNEKGISLDMTYFCVDGVHYVMWSNRVILGEGDAYGSVCEPADIYIATIDPDEPWQLTTNPVCIIRPKYGWDRVETEVDEGPYLLRRGDDLFVTISGSSTAYADLYCVGLLHAKRGDNLLSPEGWDWLPYPVLTKESVENQFGPGHNSFVRDPDSGDDLIVYHAVPHNEDGKPIGRHMGLRRVHWGTNGYPYLEMTAERDLNPKFKDVTLRVIVK
jgi:GH43 family beta-xylosidase